MGRSAVVAVVVTVGLLVITDWPLSPFAVIEELVY